MAGSNFTPVPVKAEDHPGALAGKLNHMTRDGVRDILLTAIGAPSISTAVKAVILANRMLEPEALRLAMIPTFFKTDMYCAIEKKTQKMVGIQFDLNVEEL